MVEGFRECFEYQSELGKYDVGVFMTYFDNVTSVLIEKGVDATFLILTELRESLIPSKPIQ